jgi:hypothetical protein
MTRLEDLLQAEAGDMADIPNIGENAAAILEAARAEAGRRKLTVGGKPEPGAKALILWCRPEKVCLCDLSHEGELHISVGSGEKILCPFVSTT